MLCLDSRDLRFGEEVKGFNHSGHRGSQGNSATHKCRSVWRTAL